MRVEGFHILPAREDGEMVRTRGLLEHVILNIPRLFSAFLGQMSEQTLSFVLAWGWNVNMSNDTNRISCDRCCFYANGETVMNPLVAGIAIYRFKFRPKLQSLLRLFMRKEYGLIFPTLENHKTVRAGGFLKHMDVLVS